MMNERTYLNFIVLIYLISGSAIIICKNYNNRFKMVKFIYS